jgi:hypothetical protein
LFVFFITAFEELRIVSGSISDPDPHWICIRWAFAIRIRNADPDPDSEGGKSAPKKKKNKV